MITHSTKLYTLSLLLSIFYVTAWSQPSNNNCANALSIDNPSDYCSGNSEFTSLNAGGSEYEASGCFEDTENDVWFRFTAIASAINIVVNADVGGNLNGPRVVLYEGFCGFELQQLRCEAKNSGPDVVNLLSGNLTVGRNYLIRVGGQNANTGSFQLCVNNFNPPIEPGQDGATAALLCDKSGFVIQALSGGGADDDEAAGTCLDVGFGATENQSSWTTWIADNNGRLVFDITPLNANDDIDFVVYELPNGINNFTGKIAVRCMASNCIGATGLNDTSTDVSEDPGCFGDSDNYLRALQLEEGKAYALLINNFSNTGIGISLNFGGDAEFRGPSPDFNIEVSDNVLTCDKILNVIDNSEDALGQNLTYEWNFGADADPLTAEGAGPFEITYSTFGTKFVVLSIESDLGCRTTEIREIEIQPCCEDVQSLSIDVVNQQNIGCGTAETGSLSIAGSGGFEPYQYGFEGGDYGTQTFFDNLPEGDYEFNIIDSKGCEGTEVFSIINVNPVVADAGPDQSVEFLGDSTQLDGSFTAETAVEVSWTPSEFLFCPDGSNTCLDPVVIPQGTTTYTLTITDENGCMVSDEVTVEVLKVRPLFAPNAFSPNEDGINDVFTLYGNLEAISSISIFSVFDRWGNKVYEGRNLSPTDEGQGWNGKLNNVVLDEGIYIWFATVELVTGEEMVLKGEVLLLQ